MFGNPVTDGTQSAIGTNGYVASFDLTNHEPQRVFQVQAQKDGVLSTPITSVVALDVLFAYPEASSPPNLAFAQNGNVVFVFFKTATYPFTADSRITFWFYRNAKNVSGTGSKLDIPQESKELCKAMILEKLYNILGKPVSWDISESIRLEKADLGI